MKHPFVKKHNNFGNWRISFCFKKLFYFSLRQGYPIW